MRAIAGWPLGATTRHGTGVEMQNLVGSAVAEWHRLMATPGVALNLYGKAEERAGRKMGHWTRVLPR